MDVRTRIIGEPRGADGTALEVSTVPVGPRSTGGVRAVRRRAGRNQRRQLSRLATAVVLALAAVAVVRFATNQARLVTEQSGLRSTVAHLEEHLDALGRQQDATMATSASDLQDIRNAHDRLQDRFENAGLTGTPVHAVIPVGSSWAPAKVAPDSTTFSLTDVLLQNPGDVGTGLLQITLGGEPIITMNLADFRSIDYHFVAPLRAPVPAPIAVAGSCASCSILVAGFASP